MTETIKMKSEACVYFLIIFFFYCFYLGKVNQILCTVSVSIREQVLPKFLSSLSHDTVVYLDNYTGIVIKTPVSFYFFVNLTSSWLHVILITMCI